MESNNKTKTDRFDLAITHYPGEGVAHLAGVKTMEFIRKEGHDGNYAMDYIFTTPEGIKKRLSVVVKALCWVV